MLETFAVIFTLISVWLTTKSNIWCWLTGLVGIILYSILFIEERNWSNVILQGLFIIQSIYGWVKWKSHKDNLISKMDPILTSIFISSTMFLVALFYVINTLLDGELILLDSITTSLSIIGMILLANKRLESWIWWMIADIFYIVLFLNNHLYLSSGIYFVFLCLAIKGYYNWRKILNGIF